MYKLNATKFFIKEQIAKLQTLEELDGPDSIEQYVAVMTALKIEIDKRIDIALSNFNN